MKAAEDLLNETNVRDKVFSDNGDLQTPLQDQLEKLKHDHCQLEKQLRKFSLLKEIGYLDALCQFQEMTSIIQTIYQEMRTVQPSLNLEGDQARDFPLFLIRCGKSLVRPKSTLLVVQFTTLKGLRLMGKREPFARAKHFLEEKTRRLKDTNMAVQEQLIARTRIISSRISHKIDLFEQNCLLRQENRAELGELC